MASTKNGRAGVGALRKMPVVTTRIELESPYDGFSVTMWSDPPMRVFTDIQQNADYQKLRETLRMVIVDWDLVDRDGKPIPAGDIDGIGPKLVGEILTRYLRAISSASAVPKA